MVWSALFSPPQTAEEAYRIIDGKSISEQFNGSCPFPRFDESITPLMLNALFYFQRERAAAGMAVDFAATRPGNVVKLLQQGWKVIAVDKSKEALNTLKAFVDRYGSNWIDDQQITFVESEIEQYQFPENVQLICLNDALCYSNPKKFEEIWRRAHAALQPKGRLLGEVFFHQKTFEQCYLTYANAWSLPWWPMKALLLDKGYKIEIYQSQNRFQPPLFIQFLARR